jgi:hypothetical protein
LWKQLPPLDWANKVTALSEGATALVNAGDTILVAAKDIEEGRSLSIATDGLWRWRFSPELGGTNPERAYYRFWTNALRWLVRDPEHARVRVTPLRRHFANSARVDVDFTVLSQDYQPVANAALSATLEQIGTTTLNVEDLITDEKGQAHLHYPELDKGAYKVTAKASLGDTEIGHGSGTFIVAPHSIEYDHAAPRVSLLKAIAKATHGYTGDLSDNAWDKLELKNPNVVEINKRQNIELWDNFWALCVAVVLFGADWAYRRRRGYL